MADDNEAKPQTRSQADKERSRQQSRSVSTSKSAGSKSAGSATTAKSAKRPQGSGGGKGAQGTSKKAPAKGGRNGSAARPTRGPSGGAPRRSPTTLLTWGGVALVLIIVIVLVVVKITGSSTSSSGGSPTAFTPLPASVAQDVTNIPASVYDTVGVNSPAATVTPPTVISGKNQLTVAGKPGVFYLGGEYCPYCAAERWSLTAALSRFGKFTNLGAMSSSSTDVFPSTQTMTFYKATFASSYLGFHAVEHYSNVIDPSTNNWAILQPLTAADSKLISTYYTSKYLPDVSTSGGVSIPFIDIGNNALVTGASYSPSILAGLSRAEIASNLSDPTNPVTQAIITSANYLTATMCVATNNQPSSVCTSKGVMAAAKKLKLTS